MNPSEPVSVVITTYNRSDALLAVLDALQRQTDRSFEVVVADDGSSDLHRRRILESPVARALQVVHVWHPDVGFTASKVRNRGVREATSDYVIFLDGDCVPERDFIARHRALAQPGYFVNGSRVLLSPLLTQRVLDGTEQVDGRSALYWLRQRIVGGSSKLTGLLRLPDVAWRIDRSFSLKGIRSANMAFWRQDYETIDGFDESFIGWGHEDADVALRLHHAGVVRKNGFCATEVFHLWHQEASRNKESHNAQVVRARASASPRVIRAAMGYSQARVNDDVEITRLG